jgi:hypothetical protein
MRSVALGIPSRGKAGSDIEALATGVASKATDGRSAIEIHPRLAWSSLLPYTFNMLWAGFLGMRESHKLTHFAMIHDDIVPDAGWLDVLIAELEANDADIVSAVVPIKGPNGLTSTGVDDTGDQWNPRRLTLTQVYQMPATFGDAEAGGPLLANTGLWVCRFDRPWVERVAFRQQDRITRYPDGRFVPETKPEDWDFSRQVRSLGGRILATRKVGLAHEREEWHNRAPWGRWAVDEDLAADRAIKEGRLSA